NLDEADKESAYEIAMSLYESGYFYSVEMNMIGISGDATCDNSVDVCDAVLIARFLAEDSEASMTEQGRRNADYNADGDITPDDIALILKKIARLI
ncbi:MAG: dockerin type I repeat-containing protein, partial [Lachnospiraceae bacterium]|nr:dockerin type I repeat-containing protein [Lachnospiraceae bacterium]